MVFRSSRLSRARQAQAWAPESRREGQTRAKDRYFPPQASSSPQSAALACIDLRNSLRRDAHCARCTKSHGTPTRSTTRRPATSGSSCCRGSGTSRCSTLGASTRASWCLREPQGRHRADHRSSMAMRTENRFLVYVYTSISTVRSIQIELSIAISFLSLVHTILCVVASFVEA